MLVKKKFMQNIKHLLFKIDSIQQIVSSEGHSTGRTWATRCPASLIQLFFCVQSFLGRDRSFWSPCSVVLRQCNLIR